MSKIYPIIQDAKLTRKLLVSGVIVIATEIIATIYAFLGLFGLVLINIPIFALILTILVIVNLLMFAVALKARESLGIRSALALIVWSGMVFGYWVFAPIYYLLSMHFDAIQLRWVVFAFIWEVPAVGGMFILLVLFLFRPLYRFLEGKSEEIKFE